MFESLLAVAAGASGVGGVGAWARVENAAVGCDGRHHGGAVGC
jgi:hypothetical protein